MSAKKKKKRKLNRNIRRTAVLTHRIALSLQAETETLQKKLAWLVRVTANEEA